MGLTATSMLTKYKAKLGVLGITFNHGPSETFIKALFEAIIEDIQTNGEITSSGAHAPTGSGDHVHGTGTIS